MLVDELELEAWLRHKGESAKSARRTSRKLAKWSFHRITAGGEAYAVHSVRPRLKLIPAEHLLQREEVPA